MEEEYLQNIYASLLDCEPKVTDTIVEENFIQM